MDNVVLIVILLAIVGLAVWYIIRAKKSGKKCIGCPDGCCNAKNGDTSACSCCNQSKQ